MVKETEKEKLYGLVGGTVKRRKQKRSPTRKSTKRKTSQRKPIRRTSRKTRKTPTRPRRKSPIATRLNKKGRVRIVGRGQKGRKTPKKIRTGRRSEKKYVTRKSPPFSANSHCYQRKRGNDKRMWYSQPTRAGICRWIRTD